MQTLYDLFGVKENATLEEIKIAYEKIIAETSSRLQDENVKKQVSKIKIAYGILSSPEKRKKYDEDLANKRAEILLENMNQQKKVETEKEIDTKTEGSNEQISTQQLKMSSQEKSKISKVAEELSRDVINQQVKKIEKAQEMQDVRDKMAASAEKETLKEQKKQERRAKRKAKKEEQLRREDEIYEYGKYLENQGYKVKYPWTWLRIKRLIISIVVVIIALVILWHIPFVHNALINLYEENFVIKFIVDLFI